MFTDKHTFNSINPSLESFRLVYDHEKERIISTLKNDNIKLYSINIDHWYCKTLNAKIGDIICIKNHISNFYRKVK